MPMRARLIFWKGLRAPRWSSTMQWWHMSTARGTSRAAISGRSLWRSSFGTETAQYRYICPLAAGRLEVGIANGDLPRPVRSGD
jgi:hypothetical protein